jgi:hypothetical protein
MVRALALLDESYKKELINDSSNLIRHLSQYSETSLRLIFANYTNENYVFPPTMFTSIEKSLSHINTDDANIFRNYISGFYVNFENHFHNKPYSDDFSLILDLHLLFSSVIDTRISDNYVEEFLSKKSFSTKLLEINADGSYYAGKNAREFLDWYIYEKITEFDYKYCCGEFITRPKFCEDIHTEIFIDITSFITNGFYGFKGNNRGYTLLFSKDSCFDIATHIYKDLRIK